MKRGTGSAQESGVGSAAALLVIWGLSFTPYQMDAITAGALVTIFAALSSKVLGDRR